MYVRLAQDWTDEEGRSFSAGDLVDVDTGTLKNLEATGIVAPLTTDDTAMSWPGPSASGADWAGPTGSGEDESWAG